MNKHIVVYGSLAYDYALHTESLEQMSKAIHPRETAICSVLADKVTFGGNGGNIAYYLARMGAKPVLVSTVGYDGDSYMRRLASLDIDARYIHTEEDLPTTSVWLVQDNVSSVAFFDDRASLRRTMDVPDDVLAGSIVHVGPGKPEVTMAAIDKSKGLASTIVWDPGQDTQYFSASDIASCLATATIVIVNKHELPVLLRTTSAKDVSYITEKATLIETRGSEGVMIHVHGADSVHVPSVSPEKVISSWGAGDAFRAGFLQAFSGGSSFKEAAEHGCAVASLAVESYEAQREDVSESMIQSRLSR